MNPLIANALCSICQRPHSAWRLKPHWYAHGLSPCCYFATAIICPACQRRMGVQPADNRPAKELFSDGEAP